MALGDAGPFPGFSNHLMTDDFWRTFPGPVFAVLTLLSCGFAAVWVLGSKGFCTYACPYGAVFSAADKLSFVRIVVDDGCKQTGQCTASCTSNVKPTGYCAMFTDDPVADRLAGIRPQRGASRSGTTR